MNRFDLYEFLNALLKICSDNHVNIDESLLFPVLILIEVESIARKYCGNNVTVDRPNGSILD